MWFSLFVVVLILTITFFQGLQGVFTALINFLLTVLAAALAFGFYESLYSGQLVAYQPEHGRAIALMAIFLVALLVLRTIFDLAIKHNMQFPVYADRIGAGVLGFFTAMIIVGMMAISVQMLPFGRSFLGFSRYILVDNTEQPVQPEGEQALGDFLAKLDWSKVRLRRQSLWLNPDGFTVGLAGYLSDYALQGTRRFKQLYPDFLGMIYHAHAGPCAASRSTVPPDCLRVTGAWDLPAQSLDIRQTVKDLGQRGRSVQLKADTEPPAPGAKRILLRVHLDKDATDEDRFYRFVTNQFRLLVHQPQTDSVVECFPIGINYGLAARWIRIHPGEPFTRKGDAGLDLDLVFEIPEQARPWFLEYKLNARAAVPPIKAEAAPPPLAPPEKQEKKKGKGKRGGPAPAPKAQTPPPAPAKPTPRAPAPQATERPRDRVSGVRATEAGSQFSDLLPFELTDYRTEGDFSTSRDTIIGGTGRLIAPFNADGTPVQGNRLPLRRFDVPAGKRLLQLRVNELQPQSWIGNILGHVTRTIQRYYLVDEAGNRYLAVGVYAIANSDIGRIMELVYFDETARVADKPAKLEHIRHQDLAGDYELYFLFHVPPGTRVRGFDTGRRMENLSHLNLVAPQ